MNKSASGPAGSPADQAESPRAPLALKLAVIVMGVLLVAGFAVVIITIAYRASNPRPPQAAAGFAPADIALPPGAVIEHTVLQGERALITVRTGEGSYQVIVLDLDKGREAGRFSLAPERGGP